MNQALYAHMNNKRKRKKKKERSYECNRELKEEVSGKSCLAKVSLQGDCFCLLLSAFSPGGKLRVSPHPSFSLSLQDSMHLSLFFAAE
jgi:hypothetical protein